MKYAAGMQTFTKWVAPPLLATVVFLLIGEGIARWYFARHISMDIEMAKYATEIKRDSDNPLIGHVHRPSSSAKLMGVDVHINSDGLRDRETPPGKQGRRFVVLGDSLTFGWGVRKQELFETLLEDQLSRQEPTDIINFGTGNYNTSQEVNLFLAKGLKYSPDRVVVFFFLNDAEPTPRKSRFGFLGHSRLLTFYWSRIHALGSRWMASRRYEEYYRGLYREDQPGWIQAREAFLRLKDVCSRNAIGLQVVLLPELHSLQPYPFEREHELVRSFLKEHDIPCLDLMTVFPRDIAPGRLWVASDDAHPNALGHRLIAEYVFPFLAGEIRRHANP